MARVLAPRLAPLALALLLGGCGGPAPAPRPHVYRVTIANMAFGPSPTGLQAGDSIEWVNDDIFQHSATARNGAFDVDLPPKAHATTVLKTPGRLAFYCKYHPGMAGTLVVAS